MLWTYDFIVSENCRHYNYKPSPVEIKRCHHSSIMSRSLNIRSRSCPKAGSAFCILSAAVCCKVCRHIFAVEAGHCHIPSPPLVCRIPRPRSTADRRRISHRLAAAGSSSLSALFVYRRSAQLRLRLLRRLLRLRACQERPCAASGSRDRLRSLHRSEQRRHGPCLRSAAVIWVTGEVVEVGCCVVVCDRCTSYL